MTEPDEPFPDIESVLIGYLGGLAATGETAPEAMDSPFIRVNRVGGADDGVTDRPRVELACHASTRREAQQLADQARQWMLACDSTDAAGVFIDHVATEAQSGRTPYPNEDVRRIPSIYRLSLRRPR